MARDHGPSVKNDNQYQGLKQKGMSKSRAGGNRELRGRLQLRRQAVRLARLEQEQEQPGRQHAEKKAAGRKGGKATANKS